MTLKTSDASFHKLTPKHSRNHLGMRNGWIKDTLTNLGLIWTISREGLVLKHCNTSTPLYTISDLTQVLTYSEWTIYPIRECHWQSSTSRLSENWQHFILKNVFRDFKMLWLNLSTFSVLLICDLKKSTNFSLFLLKTLGLIAFPPLWNTIQMSKEYSEATESNILKNKQ